MSFSFFLSFFIFNFEFNKYTHDFFIFILIQYSPTWHATQLSEMIHKRRRDQNWSKRLLFQIGKNIGTKYVFFFYRGLKSQH